MRIELPVNDGDDPRFVRRVESLLIRAVTAAAPDIIYVTRLDNWFGDRWYGFRGKVLGVVGFHNKRGNKDFLLPPFVPERVLSETCYRETSEGEYAQAETTERLAIHQIGSANFQRRLERFTRSGVLIWYSGNSASQGCASAMLYANTSKVVDAWYLGVRRDNEGWRFQKGIGITKREFEATQPANTA